MGLVMALILFGEDYSSVVENMRLTYSVTHEYDHLLGFAATYWRSCCAILRSINRKLFQETQGLRGDVIVFLTYTPTSTIHLLSTDIH